MDPIKVMLADDHVLLRQGTRELLDQQADIQVVAEAGDGEEAVWLAHVNRPDVIVVDIAMPKLNGLEATRQIKAANPNVAVLVLTAYDDDEYVFAFLEAGAAGYLLKDVGIQDLIEAIRAVHAGESVLHRAVTRKVIEHFRHMARPQPGEAKPISEHLTGRETQVLRLAAKGMTNRQIAAELSISDRTVQAHLSNVFNKLGVGSRTEAVLYAVREGWLSLKDTS